MCVCFVSDVVLCCYRKSSTGPPFMATGTRLLDREREREQKNKVKVPEKVQCKKFLKN